MVHHQEPVRQFLAREGAAAQRLGFALYRFPGNFSATRPGHRFYGADANVGVAWGWS